MNAPINLASLIREIPDFPKEGILFKDITPLLQDPNALKQAVEDMAAPFKDAGVDLVLGPDARGFIFGPGVACQLGAGFVPVRKAGKLPYKTRSATYALEYGEAELFIHEDAVAKGQKVLIVDDLLATGGTAEASCGLVESLGGEVVGLSFLIELGFLKGREKLSAYKINALID